MVAACDRGGVLVRLERGSLLGVKIIEASPAAAAEAAAATGLLVHLERGSFLGAEVIVGAVVTG